MSDNSNTPQPFDAVLGGNNSPKKKIEKPKLKKKADLKNNTYKASPKTEPQQSSSTDRNQKKNLNKSQTEDKTELSESQSNSENSEEEGCCETGCGCLILLIIIGGIAQLFT